MTESNTVAATGWGASAQGLGNQLQAGTRNEARTGAATAVSQAKIRIFTPPDGRSTVWGVFYGLWSGLGTVRALAKACPAVPGLEGTGVAAAAAAASVVAPVLIIVAAGLETAGVAYHSVVAVLDKHRADKLLTQAEQKYRQAVLALHPYRKHTIESPQRMSLERSGLRRRHRATVDGASERQALLHHSSDSSDGSAESAGSADTGPDADPGADFDDDLDGAPDAAERHSRSALNLVDLHKDATEAELRLLLAHAGKIAAKRDLVDAGLNTARDVVAQGGLVGSAGALALKQLFANVHVALEAAGAAAQAFGIALGAAHVGTGVVGFVRGLRIREAANASIHAFNARQAELAAATTMSGANARTARHAARVRERSTVHAMAVYRKNRKREMKQGTRQTIWSGVRVGYGAVSLGVGIATIVTLSTGGLALPVAAGCLAAAWLFFAVYRVVCNGIGIRADRSRQANFARALQLGGTQLGLPPAVHLFDPTEMALLPDRYPHLKLWKNKYFMAALLTRQLQAANPPHASTRTADELKALRLEASAALQAMNMPKAMTHQLKTCTFELAHDVIAAYLNDAAMHTAMSRHRAAGIAANVHESL